MVQNHPKMAQFSSHFGPCMTTKRPYGRKRLQARGPQKAQKQSKTAFFGNLMHRIASLSPCLRYRIQMWGHWHHYNGFTISKKNTHLFFAKIMVFGAPEIFLSPRPTWTCMGKKWGMSDLELQNELWRGSWFFRNAWVKIRRNRPTFCVFFGQDTPYLPFWTSFVGWKKC